MAEVIVYDFRSSGKGRKSEYDWESWFEDMLEAKRANPNKVVGILFRKDEDFTCKPISFGQAARKAASEKGYSISVHKEKDDANAVYIQIHLSKHEQMVLENEITDKLRLKAEDDKLEMVAG